MKKYWINSNNSDYILTDDDVLYYIFCSIPTYSAYVLSKLQFENIQGFVPIKYKKLKNALEKRIANDKINKIQTIIPSIEDIRNEKINNIIKK